MLNIILSVICFVSFCVFIITLVIWFRLHRKLPITNKSLNTKQRLIKIIMLLSLTITIITFVLYIVLVNN